MNATECLNEIVRLLTIMLASSEVDAEPEPATEEVE